MWPKFIFQIILIVYYWLLLSVITLSTPFAVLRPLQSILTENLLIFDARMQYNRPCKCSRSWLLSTEINKCCTAKDGNKIEMMKLSLQPCYTLSKISCMIKMSFERKMKFKKIVSAGFEKGKLLWNSHGLLYKKRPQRMQTLAIK